MNLTEPNARLCFLNTFALENPIEPSCKGTQSITALSLFPPMGPLFENVLNYWMDGKKNVSVNEQRQMYRRTDGRVTEEWMVILKRQSISHTIYIPQAPHTPLIKALKYSTCMHTCTQHTLDLDGSRQRKKKSINTRESVKGSFFDFLFVFIIINFLLFFGRLGIAHQFWNHPDFIFIKLFLRGGS